MIKLCVPISARRVMAAEGPAIEVRSLCWGTDVDAPDLPELDITDPDPDLPGETLPETAPDVVNPGDESIPGTQTEAKSEEEVTEEACTQACDACSAAREGRAAWRRYEKEDAEYHLESTWQGYRYQAFICGLPHDPVGGRRSAVGGRRSAVGGRIMEWQFAAYSWDGFEAATCRMIETKYGYDSLLEHYYESSLGPDSAVYSVRPKADVRGWAFAQFERLLGQATRQKARLVPFPEVGLLWVFAHFDSWVFFRNTGGALLMIDDKHEPIDPA